MQIERIAAEISRAAWTTLPEVDAVVELLLRSESGQEWKDKDPPKLRRLAQEAIKLVFPPGSQQQRSSSSSSKVMSLNQTVFQLGHQNNPSKRHKPEGTEASSDSAAENGPAGGEGAAVAAVAVVAAATLETGSGGGGEKKKVKRKVESAAAEGGGAGGISSGSSSRAGASFLAAKPALRLRDLAGMDSILDQVRELVFYSVEYPELYAKLGIHPPCGLLLRGPSGCGKTALACAIAGELSLPFFKASGPELVGGASGESESRIRDVFAAASAAAPSILFLDGIDVIAAKHDSNQRGMDRRIIVQLLDCIDAISARTAEDVDPAGVAKPPSVEVNLGETRAGEEEKRKKPGMVILLAATNKPDSLDASVRGRFSKELSLPVPDAPSRTKIIKIMAAEMRLGEDVRLDELGKMTPGFVGADLKALVREAGMLAVSRILSAPVREENLADVPNAAGSVSGTAMAIDPVNKEVAAGEGEAGSEEVSALQRFPDEALFVYMEDFLKASKTVMPSAKREGFAVVPDVTWSDVGALSEVREELLHNVLEPIAHPDWFRSLGLEVPAGVLFFGPPGCGKTLLAKAVANQSGANFISVKGPELLNMFVGESESRVRQVFSRARASAPCVIFFDELDALCPRRGSGDSGNGVSERVVNQLLTELDGLETRKDVYIIAATNRLELIDDAMLRPGRLGKLLYVPLPTPSDRVSILSALTRTTNIDFDLDSPTRVNVEAIGRDARTDGFSGADLSALVREAGLAVVREWRDSRTEGDEANGGVWDSPCIRARHFEAAFARVKPSVAAADRDRYEKVHAHMKAGMSAIQALSLEAAKR